MIVKNNCTAEPNLSFEDDNRGATAILFAFMMMMLVCSTGIAIDYSSALSERTSMQSAADAAALAVAGVTSGDDDEQEEVGESFFKANVLENGTINVSVSVSGGVITVDASKSYSTQIMSVFGIESIAIDVQAQAPVPVSGRAEVVLVLDYSDSMLDNDKFVRLKDAAHQMIDALSSNGTNPNVRFGVVPFAAMVHTDLPAGYIRSDVVYDGCTQDRRYPSNTQEASGFSDDSKWGEVTSGHTCTEMSTAGLKVLPLNSDANFIKSKISAMVPHLWTHIALGAEIGQQVISPSGPFSNATAYSDSSTVKVFVLLSDGMQTAPGWGPGNVQTAAHGEDNLKAICNAMKLKNIEVFTVGYDLTDIHTLNLLKDCAKSGNFYDAQDIDTGLLASFGDISAKIRQAMVRLTR